MVPEVQSWCVHGTQRGMQRPLACSRPPLPLPQAEQSTHILRQVFVNGSIATLAGTPGVAGTSEGLPALSSLLSSPSAVAQYLGGFVFTNRGTCRISMLWPNNTISTVAGNGVCALGGDGGLALNASVKPNWGMIVADPAGAGGGFVFSDQGRGAARSIVGILL